ncbi:MAG: alanine--tRNA ligase, partial [Planctomycetota bacterium]
MRSAAQVRQEFIDFFRSKEHAFVPSSPVVPHDDPTLLFTNAGMNQFKPYFLGTEKPKHTRVANTQKCIRAGGKHNDLDDVGHDTYHHTFFEMLGNWSFGDYFKAEAIEWAWELLTKVWELDAERLHATYFEGDEAEGLEPDIEARDLWLKILPAERVHPGNKKDNFWEMGETGPCGPCSEIHVDLTPDKSGARLVNAGDARAIEIWNLVFIQFNRDGGGKLTPLPAKHVDTGMGFERVTALLQGKDSNYDTDVFTPIFAAIQQVTGAPPYAGTLPDQRTSSDQSPKRERGSTTADNAPSDQSPKRKRGSTTADQDQPMIDMSYRVIADHVRCLTFALTDGAVPDRSDRGYILRRILRRAVRFGWQYLNMHEPFLYKLVPTIVEVMGPAFPELMQNTQRVADIIKDEEESFDRTLERGIRLFNQAAMRAAYRALDPLCTLVLLPQHGGVGMPVKDESVFSGEEEQTFDLDGHYFCLNSLTSNDVRSRFITIPRISSEDAFKLHDTFGFPIDLTQIMAEEKGLTVDTNEYERLMEEARERARAVSSVVADTFNLSEIIAFEHIPNPTDDSLKHTNQHTTAICRGRYDSKTFLAQEPVHEGQETALILDKTCFYSEQGGQVGDRGIISSDTGEFRVTNTQQRNNVVLHIGYVKRGSIQAGQLVHIAVDTARRATMQNHTATHVMNWALREVLGEHVRQKGSLVDHEKTRFDLAHPKALTTEEIERVELLVNEYIDRKMPVDYQVVQQQDALKINGLRAVFGERYPDEVRVMSIGVPVADLLAKPDNPEWRKYSIEFCGGTHLKSTGDIERFAIVSEEAVAKGIRRVVGVTGEAAREVEARGEELLKRADRLKTGPTLDAKTGPTSNAEPAEAETDPTEADFVTQVARLQQDVTEATIRVVDRMKLRDALADLQQMVKQQQKTAAADAADVVNAKIDELLQSAPKIGDTTIFVAEMPDVPIEQLKTGADRIKQKCSSAAILFGVRSAPPSEPQAQARGTDDETTKAPRHEDSVGSSGAISPKSEPRASATGPSPSERAAQASAKSEPRAPASGSPSEPEAPARDKASGGKALLLAAMSNDLIKR